MTKIAKNSSDIAYFQKQLALYKKQIDEDILNFTKNTERSTLQRFGTNSRIATDAYLEILNRGGKRIRGALVLMAYEMLGGQDQKMITQAARAVEMIHAYILIIDDISDRSATRRGGPSAHSLMQSYHNKHHLSGDGGHFGEAIATTAALVGNHAAQMLLANLNVEPTTLLKAISVLNYGMITTAHGQFNDIFNEVSSEVSEQDVLNVLEWKTAHYSFLNPLTFGMVLAGADCGPTDAIAPYCLNVGLAFQITDDILGTFGEEFESGKSPLDDIREGKRTLISLYALEHAKTADKNFLIQMLGNTKLNRTEFKRCQDIFVSSGALAYAKDQARKYVERAISSLEKTSNFWSRDGKQFLSGLAQYLLVRNS